ncbi:hypothetical protein [Marinimicrobium sp. ARAG 43.8]|uniref:hypothetical protein n=1 Tax=Marinimicrobium sp. ARAG 43.8 TaxID=3418719 RepID=UPI003CEFB670
MKHLPRLSCCPHGDITAMKTILSVTVGLLACVYIIYTTVMEWMMLGTITVYGKGIPDLKFSEDDIVLGAVIKIGFAMVCAFGATGFALFDHSSARLQSLGIKALGAAGLCLLMVLALTFTAHSGGFKFLS